MVNNYFKVLRGGTYSTFQDSGFFNKQHLGIAVGGVVDYELFSLSNKLLKNPLNLVVLEFCFQGPSLKLMNGTSSVLISGNVSFNIITSEKTIIGTPYKSYILKKGDVIDILSTIKSNYGYLSIHGGFKINKKFEYLSGFTNVNSRLNNSKNLLAGQKIYINKNSSNINSEFNFKQNEIVKYIRVIQGPQMNFFFQKTIKKFFSKHFKVTNSLNRMGIRLKGNTCKSINSNSLASEGITKGSIQVPGDGNPIVLMNDHPTIGGYPKIAVVILNDLSKLSQLPSGSEFKFKLISIKDAENLFKKKMNNLTKLLKRIK